MTCLSKKLLSTALFTLCLFVLPTSISAQSIMFPSGPLLSAVAPNATCGNVTIRTSSDLFRYGNCGRVLGNLKIYRSTSLTTANFPYLTEVTGTLQIYRNTKLTTVSMPKLHTVGSVSITYNSLLQNVDGLGSLETVNGNFTPIETTNCNLLIFQSSATLVKGFMYTATAS